MLNCVVIGRSLSRVTCGANLWRPSDIGIHLMRALSAIRLLSGCGAHRVFGANSNVGLALQEAAVANADRDGWGWGLKVDR